MKRYTSLIIDDERLARVTLRKKLAAFPEIEVLGEAADMETAIKSINSLQPDLLFLDIQLSDGTGFDLLDQVEYNGKIVFVTAYNEFAYRAFEINALDYLMKPVSLERLKIVMTRILDQKDKKPEISQKYRYDDRIMIEGKKSIHFIRLDSLVCIKADRDYTMLYDNNGKNYLVLKSISEWQKNLPDEHFVRVHRSSIINFNYIEQADKVGNTATVFLKGIQDPVSISRGYYKIIKNRYFIK